MTAPVHYKTVDPSALAFGAMEREGKLYTVRLQSPLVVQTPPVKLTSSLVDDDGETIGFAYITPSPALAAFLRKAEDAILDACLANKREWFKKDLDDDALRAGFKSFFRPSGTFRVKVPDDVAVFDTDRNPVEPAAAGGGCQVRCILELVKISFGKTEFGAAWKMTQVQTVATPRCLIREEAEGATEDDDDFV
jgi:hypothetical protein